MRFPVLAKGAALGAVMLTLLAGLHAISGIVDERQSRQGEAEQGLVDASAGAQTLLGPVLTRECDETWTRLDGEGAARKLVQEQRHLRLTLWPTRLNVTAQANIEPRYRGLFKLNAYSAATAVKADWGSVATLVPTAEHPEGRMSCNEVKIAVALSDARGIQSASVLANGENLAILPGSELPARPRGLHAVWPLAATLGDKPLHVDLQLQLAGTRGLAWVPIGGATEVHLNSNWPHPSFGGQFLPVSRRVSVDGFESEWRVSALATAAQTAAQAGGGFCDGRDSAMPVDGQRVACLESFGVNFIEPVNPYVMSDRALKYGLLFVLLTFVVVALVEVMGRRRVHPIQYLLVGCALTLFFLLLLSLSEHLAFAQAYGAASAACILLLTFYARHVLGGVKAGLAFGAGVGVLYGALYVLLQLEQTALLMGAGLLFAVLSGVMVATRRLDWYALTDQVRAESAAH